MTNEEKKQEILKLLKENGELSTGKIAYKISSNQYKTEEILVELEKEKKVKKITDRPRGTYWNWNEKK